MFGIDADVLFSYSLISCQTGSCCKSRLSSVIRLNQPLLSSILHFLTPANMPQLCSEWVENG